MVDPPWLSLLQRKATTVKASKWLAEEEEEEDSSPDLGAVITRLASEFQQKVLSVDDLTDDAVQSS